MKEYTKEEMNEKLIRILENAKDVKLLDVVIPTQSGIFISTFKTPFKIIIEEL